MLQLLIILMEISIKPKKFTLWLVVITGLLVIMHLISSYLRYYTDHGNALPIFNMDSEVSIPTWFSQSLLLATAGILFLIATFKKGSKKSYFKHWVALGIVFVYLSVDEGARLHEGLGNPLRDLLGAGGTLLHFTWVVAGLALLATLGFVYFRFWLKLPKKTRVLFLTSAVVYTLGAVGMEMFGGYHYSQNGFDFTYHMFALVEETLEMLGVTLFIYTLLDYFTSATNKLNFKLKNS